MEGRRLERSRSDRMIFGVCGGLAAYFAIETWIVRLIFVLITIAWGAGVVAYVVLAIVMPEAPATGERAPDAIDAAAIAEGSYPTTYRDRRITGGLVLISIGVLFLLANLGMLWWFDWRRFWPLILIAIGVALVLRRERR